VAARCAFVRSGVGAVLSQNVTDPALGPRLLDLLEEGHSAESAIALITAREPSIEFRQLLAIGRTHRPASFSGERMLGTNALASSEHAVAAGNLLASDKVPSAMISAFDATRGSLGERILAALDAGRDEGGEMGPVHSAGMMLAATLTWPIVDLRIDWAEQDPISTLRALWSRYEPQMDAYVQRAVRPGDAPAYGVPGDR
jgi:uncharacterized Ntn-hydrolase superfamily protein